jgi:fatty-acyl-CoA synthase
MGFLSNLLREFAYVRRMTRLLLGLRAVKLNGPDTAADLIEKFADSTPNATAILFENQHYTYAQYDAAANKYARWAMEQGIKSGEVVALLMENRPEFLFAWAGMAKIGAVTALLNTNQTGQALAHSIKISDAKHVILGAELADNLNESKGLIEDCPMIWATGGLVEGAQDLDAALARQSHEKVRREARIGVKTRDNLFYIYTSGTTGLPKAANFSHYRFYNGAYAFAAMSGAKTSDRMYLVLPLYHSAGGVAAVGQMLSVGGSMVIRRKFSTSAFWQDAKTYNVTLVQYIGELCRYLLSAPAGPDDRNHHIRLMIGNGLRPDIWQAFKDRFNIPNIVEFYAATEGNVVLFNADGKLGAIGRIPFYMDKVFNVKLVRFDVEHEKPVRGPDGLCVESAFDEQGEAIGMIPQDPNKPLGRFEGYKGSEDTNKKILRDVFQKGDAWFRTGDLLRKDKDGYFYFVDRIGDTFRWKGENVATSEVAEVISVFPGVHEANVYGVKVPGTDGRAGMVTLVSENLDLIALADHLTAHLPGYAVPMFLRLKSEMDITGTFKHRKVDYVTEGFDPTRVHDALYFRNPADGRYQPLDLALYDQICSGAIKL